MLTESAKGLGSRSEPVARLSYGEIEIRIPRETAEILCGILWRSGYPFSNDSFDQLVDGCFKISQAMALDEQVAKENAAMYALALALATEAHQGQVYHLESGDMPYIEHCKGVAAMLSEPSDQVLGLLHDVLEDTTVTGDQIVAEFGPYIYDDLLALTHLDGEEYSAYIRRVARNARATRVKLADLHLNLAHCEGRSDPKYQSLAKRYTAAIALLTALDRGEG